MSFMIVLFLTQEPLYPIPSCVFWDRAQQLAIVPYNFVWETLGHATPATTPATTPVTASSLYNIFTITYRIVYRGIHKIAFLSSTNFVYIIF